MRAASTHPKCIFKMHFNSLLLPFPHLEYQIGDTTIDAIIIHITQYRYKFVEMQVLHVEFTCSSQRGVLSSVFRMIARCNKVCEARQDGGIKLCTNVLKSYWRGCGGIETEGSVWVCVKHVYLHWELTHTHTGFWTPLYWAELTGVWCLSSAGCRCFFEGNCRFGHGAGPAWGSRRENKTSSSSHTVPWILYATHSFKCRHL